MHYDFDNISQALDIADGAPVTFNLKDGDSAWNPASTKRLLYGPAPVEYRRFAITALSAEGTL